VRGPCLSRSERQATYHSTRHAIMKSYLITTGTIFGLIAFMHLLKAIGDREQLASNPVEFFSMAALGVVAAGLSVWAWRLLRSQPRP